MIAADVRAMAKGWGQANRAHRTQEDSDAR